MHTTFDATYCTTGHYIGSTDTESQVSAFCKQCGAKSVSQCEHCSSHIETLYMGEKPYYCGNCGKPYPWTEMALSAAKEYADELQLTPADRDALKGTFPDLTSDTPRTPLAITRFKRYMSGLAPAATEVLNKILVDVMTAAVKQQMGL
jgi:hypothetical protein